MAVNLVSMTARRFGTVKLRSGAPELVAMTEVGVVAHWARKKFHLDPKVAAEFVLQLCKSTERPRPDTHLGELVKAPHCSVCFDLVKEVTPQG